MTIQYLEMFKKDKIVYQGVTMGERDTQNQIGIITRNVAVLGHELVCRKKNSWDIIESDTREKWGSVQLRSF